MIQKVTNQKGLKFDDSNLKRDAGGGAKREKPTGLVIGTRRIHLGAGHTSDCLIGIVGKAGIQDN